MSKKYECFGSKSLQEVAAQLDHEKQLICQVVATDGSAWNMFGTIYPANDNCSLHVLQLSHPDIETLGDGKRPKDAKQIHYELSMKAYDLAVSKYGHMECQAVRELPDVKRLYDAMDVIKELYLTDQES